MRHGGVKLFPCVVRPLQVDCSAELHFSRIYVGFADVSVPVWPLVKGIRARHTSKYICLCSAFVWELWACFGLTKWSTFDWVTVALWQVRVCTFLLGIQAQRRALRGSTALHVALGLEDDGSNHERIAVSLPAYRGHRLPVCRRHRQWVYQHTGVSKQRQQQDPHVWILLAQFVTRGQNLLTDQIWVFTVKCMCLKSGNRKWIMFPPNQGRHRSI